MTDQGVGWRRGRPSRPRREKALQGAQEVHWRLEEVLGKRLSAELFATSPAIDDAESAANLMRGLIRAGVLRVGDPVPADALATVFDLHRNTMSRALSLLAAEGYVQRRRGRPARVVSTRAVLPDRRSQMISHTEVARRHGMELRSDVIRLDSGPVSEVLAEHDARVGWELELADSDAVVMLSRIRKLGRESSAWIPAIAETAYFAVERLSAFPEDDLRCGRLESIADYFRSHHIRVVNSEYRIRISRLPESFHASWAKCGGMSAEAVGELRFLRFESTSHSHLGPVEYSAAYFREGLFAISATDLGVEIRADDLAQAFSS
jgi:DNA-binding GntR family transcriptional regulator